MTSWPEPVERVAAYLREAGAEARIEEFETRTPTAEDAARAVGCELAQIVKSLVFDCDGDGVARDGARRPACDLAQARATRPAAARRAIADAGEVERVTGFEPGAVAPFPLPAVDARADRSVAARVTTPCGSEPARRNHLAAARAGRARPPRAGRAGGRGRDQPLTSSTISRKRALE